MTDWPVKTLGEVVRFDSETARPEDLSSKDVYVGLENIASDGTLAGLGNVSAETLKSNKARFTDKHILFGKLRPYLVKVVRPDFSGVCSTDILPINPSAELSRDYLYWYMRSPAVIEAATEASTGTTLPRVSPTILKSFEIPVPPLEEQKRIVALLDATTACVTELTECYELARTHANNLFESLFDDCFELGVADTPLGDVADLNGGYAFKSSDYTERGVFVLRTLNIDAKGNITRRKPVFVSEMRTGEFDRFKLFADDILFVMVGATLGKTGVVKEADLPALLNQNMWVIRAKNDSVDPRYLYYVFMKYSKTLLSSASGTARAFVKRDDFRNLMVPVPSLREQKRIVARLDSMKAKTSGMVAAYDAKLTAAKNLRQSILEAAFAGEL